MTKARILRFGVLFSLLSAMGAGSTASEALRHAQRLPDTALLMNTRAALAAITCLVSLGFLGLCLTELRAGTLGRRLALAATVGIVVEGVYQLIELGYFGSLLFEPSPTQGFFYAQFGLFATWTFLKLRYYLAARRAFS